MSQSLDYQKGYFAGRKRIQKDIDFEARDALRNEHWLKFYASVMPAAMSTNNWTITTNGVKEHVTSLDERVELAVKFVDKAFNLAIAKGKIK